MDATIRINEGTQSAIVTFTEDGRTLPLTVAIRDRWIERGFAEVLTTRDGSNWIEHGRIVDGVYQCLGLDGDPYKMGFDAETVIYVRAAAAALKVALDG